VLLADQTVSTVTSDGVTAELSIGRDGAEPRSVTVRLSRAGALQGMDLIEGQQTGAFGLEALSGALATVALPSAPLAPGDRWPIADGEARGQGRLERLGVVDGEEVAVVSLRTTQPVTGSVPAGATTASLDGELRTEATETFDLHDGALRRTSSRAHGTVRARIAPPAGIDADPVDGTITYEVRAEVTRTA
jgi:hypothetical protein